MANKTKIVYLRNPRVGSSAFITMLKDLEESGYIEKYNDEHRPHEKIREQVLKNKGKDFWNSSIKVVSVRNPWDQHVSYFLKTRSVGDNNICISSEIAKNFGKLPKHIQKKYINDFREIVDQQLKYVRGEVSDIYDEESIHRVPAGKFVNAVRNFLAKTYKTDQIYIHEGKSIADYCIRMEKDFLQRDLEQFMKYINVPVDSVFVQRYIAGANKINFENPNHYDYQMFYNDKTIQAVEEIRKLEIEIHGYKYEEK